MTYLSEADKISKGIDDSWMLKGSLAELRKAVNYLMIITVIITFQTFYMIFIK